MGDNPPEIRTGYLPNTILQRYATHTSSVKF